MCFERSLWRDLLEKRVRSDFPMIFEACAQTPKCKKTIKTLGFLIVSVGCVFFEKVSAVDGKRMENSVKSAVGDSKISSKSS